MNLYRDRFYVDRLVKCFVALGTRDGLWRLCWLQSFILHRVNVFKCLFITVCLFLIIFVVIGVAFVISFQRKT